ncbi:hypothetical protein ACUSIJ_01125 [Pseudochelatococcus sp. B33]
MSLGGIVKKGAFAGAAVLAGVPVVLNPKLIDLVDRGVVGVNQLVTGQAPPAAAGGAVPQAYVVVASPQSALPSGVVQQPAQQAPEGATPAYRITTVQELQRMSLDLNGSYTLANNIDASETSRWDDGRGFEPIGTEAKPFTGSFDGNGYTISGLTIARPQQGAVGLFGAADGAKISNFYMTRVNVVGRSFVGPVLGFGFDTTIKNVSAEGSVKGAEAAGGLVGFVTAGIIEKVQTAGTVSGEKGIGGLAGYTDEGAVINDSLANADVKGEESVGGLIGWNTLSVIKNTYAAGIVRGKEDVAGLVGYDEEGVVISSFWNTETTLQKEGIVSDAQNENINLKGLKSKEFEEPEVFQDVSGWNFNTMWRYTGKGAPTLALPSAEVETAAPIRTKSRRSDTATN